MYVPFDVLVKKLKLKNDINLTYWINKNNESTVITLAENYKCWNEIGEIKSIVNQKGTDIYHWNAQYCSFFVYTYLPLGK